jgi:hypothetical protein
VPLLLLVIPFLLVLTVLVLMPLSLIQRYRVGTARRAARGWLATTNAVAMSLSAVLFITVAAFSSIWIANAFTYAVLGLTGGCLLGLVGLWLSRWESSGATLHYTPNRWLVLAMTVVVTARVLYGFWRAWQGWRLAPADTSWLASAGVAGSMAAGAVVIGYYATYWMGVRRRVHRHHGRASRP